MAQKDIGNKVPLHTLKKTEDVMKFYDDWGKENKYDKDMSDWNYTGPKERHQRFLINMQMIKKSKFTMLVVVQG